MLLLDPLPGALPALHLPSAPSPVAGAVDFSPMPSIPLPDKAALSLATLGLVMLGLVFSASSSQVTGFIEAHAAWAAAAKVSRVAYAKLEALMRQQEHLSTLIAATSDSDNRTAVRRFRLARDEAAAFLIAAEEAMAISDEALARIEAVRRYRGFVAQPAELDRALDAFDASTKASFDTLRNTIRDLRNPNIIGQFDESIEQAVDAAVAIAKGHVATQSPAASETSPTRTRISQREAPLASRCGSGSTSVPLRPMRNSC